ncbi:4'-phosphopantetheinyl transferase superfamily protein [Nonomuraea sp. NPDC001023]|uniref:4'-phosphopantetheinyl transferase family protein n=1 Tax=unclassified Nonomuraea TaxID=2593643 RepID=UPI003331A299
MIASVVAPGECQVWWAGPRDHPEGTLLSVLSEPELERAARFRREADRRRFLTGSWLLRTASAVQLGVRPEDVVVDRSCPDCTRYHGKPQVRAPGFPLHVSVSHSEDRVAVAVTTEGPLGVDVEAVPADPVDDLARCALTEAELAVLEAFPQEDRYEAFAKVWVRKEAALKATGHGLRVPPTEVAVSGPADDPALLSWPLDIPPESLRFRVLSPGRGYVAAVAVITGRPVEAVEFHLPAARADFARGPLPGPLAGVA